jgi:hypothetical protein
MSETNFPLPPPTFEFLVFSLKMQAEVRLGLIGFGEESEGPDLPAARHAIDLLAMLAEKTRGNLSIEEQRLVENSLTELRFRFVQVTEDTQKSAAAKAQDEGGGASNKVEGGAETAS